MKSLPFGILGVLAVIYLSLETKNSAIYLSAHSFYIVFLGTIAIFFFANPFNNIKMTFKAIKELFEKDKSSEEVRSMVQEIASKKGLNDHHKIPLVNYALKLWKQGVEADMVETLLIEKNEEIVATTELPVSVLKNLSKYPPALGMTGTVMGMISLFANLNGDNKAMIGEALSIAMTATFYGLMFANFILLPLADRLHIRHKAITNRNDLFLTALLKINRSEPISFLENLNLEQAYYEQAG